MLHQVVNTLTQLREQVKRKLNKCQVSCTPSVKPLDTPSSIVRLVTRWALALQEFLFTIRHRPGKKNSNADALSRAPATDPPALTLPGDERSTLVAGKREAHFIHLAHPGEWTPFP